MSTTARWVGPLFGVLAVAGAIVGQAISGEIDSAPHEPTAMALDELRASADDIRLGTIFWVLAVGCLLVFIADVRTRLSGNGAGWASNVFLAGGVALVVAMIVLGGVHLAGAEAVSNGHREVAQMVVDFIWNASWIASPGLLALGVGIAVAGLIDRALPIWSGVSGVIVALSAMAPWIGVVLAGAWVLAHSIAELITTIRATQTSVVASNARLIST